MMKPVKFSQTKFKSILVSQDCNFLGSAPLIMDLLLGFFVFLGFCNVGFSDQDGFLSLACGGASNFTDASNIRWISDNEFISSGNTTTISYTDETSFISVAARFFPTDQAHNCYTLPVENVSFLVLVRAKFMYKDYDGHGKPPAFSVSLGTALVSRVDLRNTDPWIEEFVWPVGKDSVSFCLHSIKDRGAPVISSLEVRPLPQEAYTNGVDDSAHKSLRKTYRIDCGNTNGSLRYPLDPYDRIWDADQSFTPFHVSTGFKTQLVSFNASGLKENVPADILQTARVLERRDALTYDLVLDTLADNYIVLYFAGILPVFPSFDILINGDVARSNYTVRSSEVSALYFMQRGIKSLNITLKSISFYPQINAIEVYEILDIPEEASSTTVSALQVIQQSVGVDLGWLGDPCSPLKWDKVGCEGNIVTSLELSDIKLRSISPAIADLIDLKTLDLQNTSLAGEIQNLGSLTRLEKLNLSFNQLTSFGTELDNLVGLQILDLQNNSLQGMVPDSLGELEDLRLLNVENNQLQGAIPQSLNRESLQIRASGNLCLSFSTLTCNDFSANSSISTPQVTIVPQKKHTKHSNVAVILGAIGGALFAVLVLASVAVTLHLKKRRTDFTTMEGSMLDMRNWNSAKVFSYKQIKAATNNFKQLLGRGSFGAVYLGKLQNGRMVAVKVRYDKSQLGADSFVNEVHLLSRIRHQNLVCLEGFCQESKQQILVYEYLHGGSLSDHIYGPKSKNVSLSWVRRLKIAVDAAKGLDYLHNGNEPRIIHRDVKCCNILLDKEMNAKLCDFGLSKQVMQADATHVTTVVKGTAGYLDPEYYSTQQLTEKSDVYSFGVVLLELICGRQPLSHSGSPDSFNLVLWAKPYLQAGAYEIVDERLVGTFDVESMRKVALVAVRSVERDASARPTIAEVLAELKKAYSIQLAYLQSRDI